MTVKTRIAPSPTGWLHIGTARTALFNYLYAKHHGGTFAVRSEDTDRERSKTEFETEILDGLAWLGLTHDEFVRQSERLSRHQKLLESLVENGKAYISEEPSKADERQTVRVVRLHNPGTDVTFRDEIRGDINFHTGELGDFVIARAIDDPLYHLAVVVDDFDMNITHVIRGEDHISNTARQILIQEAIGAPRPIYAHLPLILAPDRSKLSKRNGATSIRDYRAEGYLPEGFVNFIALLGWSPGSDQEHFSLAELVQAFDLSGIQKSGAVWDKEKLRSVNQRWMRTLDDARFLEELHVEQTLRKNEPKEHMERLLPLLRQGPATFGEARHMLDNEFAFFFTRPTVSREKLVEKDPHASSAKTAIHLSQLKQQLTTLSETNDVERIKETLMPYADSVGKEDGGRGAVLWPLRFALSGADRSPDPFTIISILGIHEAISRIDSALAILGE